jgi:hypothetical protein
MLVPSSDGVRLAVHDLGGTGSALLVSHATGFHGRCYLPLAHELIGTVHSVAFDYRGHGDTPRPPGPIDWNAYGDDAVAIYRRDFWDRCKCDQLPAPVALLLFDCAVNQGQGTAAHLLQQAVGVKQDGIIGMITIAAARKANIKDTLSKLMAGRCFRYSVAKNVHLYGRGWFRRAAACLMTALEPL